MLILSDYLDEKLTLLENTNSKNATSYSTNTAKALKPSFKENILKNQNLVIAILFLLILILTIYLRTGMMKYEGFFSPDGFYKYAVLEQAILHNYTIPETLIYSGFPTHNYISNRLGGYYVSLYPYILLKGLGISLYTIMRDIPLVFALLDAIAIYFLMQYMSKSKVLGLIGMLMVAVSPANLSVTSALVYRGDIFISIFAIVSSILFIKAYRSRTVKLELAYAISASIVLGFGTMIWGGAPFTIAIYFLAIAMMVVIGYIRGDKKTLSISSIMAASIIIEYLMERTFVANGIIRMPEFLSGVSFFVFYLPLTAGAIIAFYIISYREKAAAAGKKINTIISKISISPVSRAEFVVAVAIILIIAIAIPFSSVIKTIASGGGLVSAQTALEKTIQELEPPSATFIWDSYNLEIILFAIGIVVYLLYAGELNNKESALGYKNLYKKIAENVTPEFVILVSYLLITGYLQSQATRYGSLFSIPVAIFSAYALYSIAIIISRKFNSTNASKYKITKEFGSWNYIYYGLATGLIIIMLMYAFTTMATSAPSDNINSQFLSALSWMKNNTPANSTVLAVWPDGSEVEGWANRQSVVDSVGGQNPKFIKGFSLFLFNDSPDVQYLNSVHNPNYIVARNYWWSEIGGIEIEGLLSNSSSPNYKGNAKNFSVAMFPSTTESKYKYGYVFLMNITKVNLYTAFVYNSTDINKSYAIKYTPGSSSYQYIKHILIYDISNFNHILINSSEPGALNSTLYVETSAEGTQFIYLLGPKFLNSNFVKIESLCNYSECNYDENGSVKLKMVYGNDDTKIFKVIYANTSTQ